MKRECYCNGSGLIDVNEKKIPCPCFRYKVADKIFQKSNTPKNYHLYVEDLELNPKIINHRTQNEARLKNVLRQFDDGANNKPIKRFIENNYRLIFFGGNGTAKSQSAVSLALMGAKRNQKFYFLSMQGVKNLFRFNFNDEEVVNKVNESKEKIKNCDILIIDDLGKEVDLIANEKNGQTLLKTIYAFLDEAIRHKQKMVIITTNLNYGSDDEKDLKVFYKKYNESLVSILTEQNTIAYEFNLSVRTRHIDELINELQ